MAEKPELKKQKWTPWKAGMRSPNPSGRPKGIVSGRKKSMDLLDKLMGDETNIEKLRDAFQAEFDGDPSKFFRVYVLPNMPRETKINFGKMALPVEIRIVSEIDHHLRTDPIEHQHVDILNQEEQKLLDSPDPKSE